MLTLEAKDLIFQPANQPFASCHASHLAVLPNGDVLAAWFAGSKEGAGDVAIWGSRLHDGRWTEPRVLADEPGLPHWNPVFHLNGSGDLLLYYKVGHLIKQWYTRVMVSKDGGHSWSEPAELVPGDRGGRGPVRNKLLVLADGTWLAPASTEDGIWQAVVDISRDQGRTWSTSSWVRIEELNYNEISKVTGSPIPVSEQSFVGRGVIQPALWESAPDQVHMLLRSSEGSIYRSDSTDGGRTWSDAYATSLPNNNSGIDVARLDDGTLVLAYNPVGVNWGVRTPLVLSVSRDNGNSWSEAFVLEEGEGEFSYPAIMAKGSRLYLTYTWNRESIVFCQLVVNECK
ncbi:sialidase family protein [Paenibacillus rigui]|uniref:Neuraminidase (Sialidase) n=1 Tax=Paenibacillus rigui TaxID=554312 RepID=A0A229UKP4_9BACL|nr:sialidase family protein [Paenibacillus rigui]OXM84028.1 neuraminidase (sialidase) [Paenibacillus rigui]